MIEQITSTYVGMVGFGGFVLVVLVGFFIVGWIKKEIKDDDGA